MPSGRAVARVVVFTQEMEEAAKRVTRIEQALRRAVSAGEVEPYFQPIVDLKTRRTVGFETLARWTDPDLGSVPPTTFIPIAEERGIIGAAVPAGPAQGGGGGAGLAGRPVPVVQPVAVADGRPEHRPEHTVRARPRRLRPAPPRDRDHRDGPDVGSGFGRQDRSTTCAAAASASRSTISAPANPRSAGCATSSSTSSRSTAVSSPRCSTTGPPSISSAPSWPCATALAST